MKDAPAFDFYPERWLTGTAMLTDAEQISYVRLLCHQWLSEGLPGDMPALRRLAGKGVTPALLEKFPVGEDGRRRNARLETIRAEQRERIAKRRAGATHTNARRWSVRHRERVASDIASDVGNDVARDIASDIVSESPPPTTHPVRRERDAGAPGDARAVPQVAAVPPELDPTGMLASPDGRHALEIVGLYPANGNLYEAARALLRSCGAAAPKDSFAFLVDVGAKVIRHAELYRALPRQVRKYCPHRVTYFSDERWRDNPAQEPWVFFETDLGGGAPENGAGPMTRDWNAEGPEA